MGLSFHEMQAAAQEMSLRAVFDEDLSNYILCDDGRYEVYTEYTDDAVSEVDKHKNITVNDEQCNLTQEENSQYVPFKLPRYWDGVDLMTKLIQFHYVNINGGSGVSTAVNVRFNDSYIICGWLINKSVTAVAGDVTFEITATGTNEKSADYRWRTRPNGKFTVLEALSYDGIIEPSDDWYAGFVKSMQEYTTKAAESAKSAQNYADQSKSNLDQVTQITETFTTNAQEVKETAINEINNAKVSGVNAVEAAAAEIVNDREKITENANNISSLKQDLVTNVGGLSEKTYVVKMSYEKGYISGDNGILGINNINYRTANIINLSRGDMLVVDISKVNAVPHTYEDGIWKKYYTSFAAFCADGYGALTATSTTWTINIIKNCDIRIVVSLPDNSEIGSISQFADTVIITKLYNYKRLDKIEDDLGKNNYWEGKKIVWFGTSIPAGVVHAGDDNGVNSYPIQVGDMLGAKVYNESVGSSAIRIGDYNSITSDDPNGYSGVPATCCLFSLSGTVDEKREIISDWAVWKNKFKYGVDEIDSIINSGTVQSRIFDRSYEVKLSKYLNNGEVGTCDLYVFDHGYNDAGNKNGVDYSDLTKVPSDSFDRTYFIGAMNYIINKIKTDNFRASICIVSHYNDEGVFSNLVEAQRYVADYWNIPFIEIYDKIGFSTSSKITISGVTKTVKDWWLPDGIHPSSDTTGKALKHYAEVLYPLLRDVR